MRNKYTFKWGTDPLYCWGNNPVHYDKVLVITKNGKRLGVLTKEFIWDFPRYHKLELVRGQHNTLSKMFKTCPGIDASFLNWFMKNEMSWLNSNLRKEWFRLIRKEWLQFKRMYSLN